jgi:hypothetical protein
MDTVINVFDFHELVPVFGSVEVVRVPIKVRSNVFLNHIGEDVFVFLKGVQTRFSMDDAFSKLVSEDVRRVEREGKRWSHVRFALRNGGLSEVKFYLDKLDGELIHLGSSTVDACGWKIKWVSWVLVTNNVKRLEQEILSFVDVKN